MDSYKLLTDLLYHVGLCNRGNEHFSLKEEQSPSLDSWSNTFYKRVALNFFFFSFFVFFFGLSIQIAFPNLEKMTVSGKFEEIWPLEITGSSFCKLRVLSIWGCRKIKTAIPSHLVHRLQNLELLNVDYCDRAEEVVMWKKDLPPKLNKICIRHCGGLRRLFSTSQARNLNQLKTLRACLVVP